MAHLQETALEQEQSNSSSSQGASSAGCSGFGESCQPLICFDDCLEHFREPKDDSDYTDKDLVIGFVIALSHLAAICKSTKNVWKEGKPAWYDAAFKKALDSAAYQNDKIKHESSYKYSYENGGWKNPTAKTEDSMAILRVKADVLFKHLQRENKLPHEIKRLYLRWTAEEEWLSYFYDLYSAFHLKKGERLQQKRKRMGVPDSHDATSINCLIHGVLQNIASLCGVRTEFTELEGTQSSARLRSNVQAAEPVNNQQDRGAVRMRSQTPTMGPSSVQSTLLETSGPIAGEGQYHTVPAVSQASMTDYPDVPLSTATSRTVQSGSIDVDSCTLPSFLDDLAQYINVRSEAVTVSNPDLSYDTDQFLSRRVEQMDYSDMAFEDSLAPDPFSGLVDEQEHESHPAVDESEEESEDAEGLGEQGFSRPSDPVMVNDCSVHGQREASVDDNASCPSLGQPVDTATQSHLSLEQPVDDNGTHPSLWQPVDNNASIVTCPLLGQPVDGNATHPSSGQPVDDATPPSPGLPVDSAIQSHPSLGQPVNGNATCPSQGQPVEGNAIRPSLRQPADGNATHPSLGQPADGNATRPSLGQPADGNATRPCLGQPADGNATHPSLGQPADGNVTRPSLVQPVDSNATRPSLGQPADGNATRPSLMQPADGNATRPSLGQPADGNATRPHLLESTDSTDSGQSGHTGTSSAGKPWATTEHGIVSGNGPGPPRKKVKLDHDSDVSAGLLENAHTTSSPAASSEQYVSSQLADDETSFDLVDLKRVLKNVPSLTDCTDT